MYDQMSLQEMKTYKGADPIPEDFDKFREDEIKNCNTNEYKLIKKDYNIKNADCYELIFRDDDGSEIYSKCMFPKNKKKSATVFYFHGYQNQSPARTYAMKYPMNDFGIVMMDVRGQCGKSTDMGKYSGITAKGHVIRGLEDGRENLFYTKIYKDVFRLIEIVSKLEFVDENMLFTQGGSQGGALALVGSALNKKIKKTVVQYPWLGDLKRLLLWQSHEEPYDELYRYFKYKDPFHITEEKVMKTLAYIDVKNFSHLIKSDVTMITGLEDIVCFPSTQYAIYNRLECEKEIYHLPEYGHETMNVYVEDFMFNKLTGSTIELL
ncbi:MAG: acetylxylan esterase [Peptoniphilaceae bacterium]|nr:acetylxylan esterase [Peptoniphilaceae bacterium]MDY3738505.1 acetylxylan esterase [Peptoniphilaceae bacterium]